MSHLSSITCDLRRCGHGDHRSRTPPPGDGSPSPANAAPRRPLRPESTSTPSPAPTPTLNPAEGLWSSLKAVEPANLSGDSVDPVIAAAERGVPVLLVERFTVGCLLRRAGVRTCSDPRGRWRMPTPGRQATLRSSALARCEGVPAHLDGARVSASGGGPPRRGW